MSSSTLKLTLPPSRRTPAPCIGMKENHTPHGQLLRAAEFGDAETVLRLLAPLARVRARRDAAVKRRKGRNVETIPLPSSPPSSSSSSSSSEYDESDGDYWKDDEKGFVVHVECFSKINKETPLAVACLNDHTAIVDVLLSFGANPDTLDQDGNTPLLYSDNPTIITSLLNANANVNAQDTETGETALFTAYKRQKETNDPTITHLLVEHPLVDVNIPTKQGERVIGLACFFGDLIWMDIFMNQIALPLGRANMTLGIGPTQSTPLHLACAGGHTQAVIACLAHPAAKLEGRDNRGTTPLMVAAKMNHPEVVRLLLNHGAHIWLIDDANMTAMHYAHMAGYTKVVNNIESFARVRREWMPDGLPPLHTGRGPIPIQTKQFIEQSAYQNNLVAKLRKTRGGGGEGGSPPQQGTGDGEKRKKTMMKKKKKEIMEKKEGMGPTTDTLNDEEKIVENSASTSRNNNNGVMNVEKKTLAPPGLAETGEEEEEEEKVESNNSVSTKALSKKQQRKKKKAFLYASLMSSPSEVARKTTTTEKPPHDDESEKPAVKLQTYNEFLQFGENHYNDNETASSSQYSSTLYTNNNNNNNNSEYSAINNSFFTTSTGTTPSMSASITGHFSPGTISPSFLRSHQHHHHHSQQQHQTSGSNGSSSSNTYYNKAMNKKTMLLPSLTSASTALVAVIAQQQLQHHKHHHYNNQHSLQAASSSPGGGSLLQDLSLLPGHAYKFTSSSSFSSPTEAHHHHSSPSSSTSHHYNQYHSKAATNLLVRIGIHHLPTSSPVYFPALPLPLPLQSIPSPLASSSSSSSSSPSAMKLSPLSSSPASALSFSVLDQLIHSLATTSVTSNSSGKGRSTKNGGQAIQKLLQPLQVLPTSPLASASSSSSTSVAGYTSPSSMRVNG